MTDNAELIERTAQALADAHTRSWDGTPVPLAEHCDADYWRDLARAALVAMDLMDEEVVT